MSTQSLEGRSVDRAAVLNQLRTKVLAVGVAFSLASTALLAAGFVHWGGAFAKECIARRNAAAGQPWTIAELLRDRPDILQGFVILGLTGLTIGLVGHLLIGKVLGPQRRQPWKLSLTLFAMPLAFAAVASVTWIPRDLVMCGVILLMGLAVAGGSLVPQLTALLAGMLTIVSRSAERRVVRCPASGDDLPPESALARHDAELRSLGFEPVGDFWYQPGENHAFRAWQCAELPLTVHVAWYRGGSGEASFASLSSLTSDGNYFETTNAPAELASSAELAGPFYHRLDESSLAAMIEFHRQKVDEWCAAAGAQPLVPTAEEIPQAEAFGLAHLSRVIRDTGRRPLFWLADPYLGFEMPPLPGRPWRRAEASLA